MTIPVLDPEAVGRAIAVTQEQLRLPTLSRADAMAMAGCESATAFQRFCRAHGIQRTDRCRYRRKEILRALEREAR